MKRTNMLRILTILLTISITFSLTGCGSSSTPIVSDNTTPSVSQEPTTTPGNDSKPTGETIEPSSATTQEEAITQEEEIPESTEATTVIPTEEQKDEYGLTEQQRNSFSMLYYLAITAEKIRISKDNRLILDDIYTSLLNDINPGAIDETTQDHLKNLRDIIKSYINISVKRDRLQYIYNQDKAATIRSAIPNPLAVLSMTNSFDWKKLATSVVYTVVDSFNNYKRANESVDKEFLMSGWELDDEETATIQKNRERAFDYMVDIVQEYNLDGKLTLNEKAIEKFAEICAIESVQQKIRRLESEENTYKLLGNYWLELADCYYETSQYQKCLDCVEKYNELATGIYRMDYNYVQILPKAIVAAQTVYSGDEYVTNVKAFADAIMENTTTEEWSIRYFAAQVYLDLYARTSESDYLDDAYNIAYDNVTILLDEQRAMNVTYLEGVKELTVDEPDYRFMTEEEKKEVEQEYKDEQKRLKAYNKSLKETRKTELPSLYEPLVLNCELLFALADEINISNQEKSEIEAILQTGSNGVFMVDPINAHYSFSTNDFNRSIELQKDKVIIPVNLLSADAKVVVTVTDNGQTVTFDDCVVTEVKREGDTVDSFFAHVSSKQMKAYKWTADSRATVKITYGEDIDGLQFQFKIAEFRDNWILADKVVFEEE